MDLRQNQFILFLFYKIEFQPGLGPGPGPGPGPEPGPGSTLVKPGLF